MVESGHRLRAASAAEIEERSSNHDIATRCSFCERRDTEFDVLVIAPLASICDECIGLAQDFVAAKTHEED